jgi:phosphatidylglycerophosphate synthase
MPPSRQPPGEFQDAQRDQSSLLAPLERRALVWMAERMPAWVNSDHLTALGLLGMLLTGLCYWLSHWNRWALAGASFGLFLNWFGDSLDGTLARVRNRLRPRYGFYIDHILDAFGTSFLLTGLALSPCMTAWVAISLLILFLLLSIQSYLATYALGTFQLSFWKFSPTELRVLLIAGNTALFLRGPLARLAGHQFLLFDVGGVCGIAGMAAMLIVATARNTVTLYRAERL